MSPTNTEQLLTPSIQSSTPAANAEGSESGGHAATEEFMGPMDTQASAPSRRKLQNHSIYLKIDGRGTNASVSVYAIQATSVHFLGATKTARPSTALAHSSATSTRDNVTSRVKFPYSLLKRATSRSPDVPLMRIIWPRPWRLCRR